MKTVRILSQMARADFLERTRRYSFLITLGLVLWLGYVSASGQFHMRISPNYYGVPNSAWVGATMTITVTFFLGWFGFYLVKGSVARDYETGVGQIMATTPLTRPLYTLGKWLSNFAVLGVMIFILLVVGILMNLLVGTADFDLWALVAPLLFIALPCMALVASVAVLFESIPWLRGGLGNIIYFFAFLGLMIITVENTSADRPFLDFMGIRLIGDSLSAAARAAYPECNGGFSFTASVIRDPQVFLWNGIAWTAGVLLSRFLILAGAAGIALLAAVFFDRFDLSRIAHNKRKGKTLSTPVMTVSSAALPVVSINLTRLTGARSRFRFPALFLAELKLLLKGQHWWWYAVAIGLILAQLFAGSAVTRILLAVAWIWPILILSGVGCRESHYDTDQIVFSAPHPLVNQLPATWLAAFCVTALMGSGAFLHFLFFEELTSLRAWMAGALFIPSLALSIGVLTGSRKIFEVIYVLWMYLILQKIPALDFIGMTPESPWYVYVLLALILVLLAAFGRHLHMKTR
jgi:ABC-type transport system involved in multi-copper enzyme maturation permease subunit